LDGAGFGRDIVFGADEFAPDTSAGRARPAHELVHTIHQGGADTQAPGMLQRQPIGAANLQAPRFASNGTLEDALDGKLVIGQRFNRFGAHVRLIQQSLLAQGYTLPEFAVDGVFGPETEAAVMQFQTDAQAAKRDGIVGPETMRLLDEHDPTLRTGVGPVPTTGPTPAPRPAPAPSCDLRFTSITFALANQVAAGVANPAVIAITRVAGKPALILRGATPPTYQPRVTITAPSDARAQEFEAGIIQNILSDTVRFTYTTGVTLRSTLPTPLKDGAPLSVGVYDTVFVENGVGDLETFTGTGATVQLDLQDTPKDAAFVNLLDNAQCALGQPAGTLTNAIVRSEFRTWIGVRHKPTGCVRTIHHIDWHTDYSATVNGAATPPTRTIVTNAIKVTQPNGNGSPSFIQGGHVPEDLIPTSSVCN